MRALILDDESIYLKVVEAYLTVLGVEDIQSTIDPIEASEIVLNERIDIIMLDLRMPKQDGVSFLRTLSEIGFEGAVIIVSGEESSVVSSSAHFGEKLGLKVCGALSKPLDFSELQKALELAKSANSQPAV